MEEPAQKTNWFQITVIVLLLIFGINLGYFDLNWFKISNDVQPIPLSQAQPIVNENTTDLCDVNCQKQVNQMVSQALATISAQSQTKTTTVKQVVTTEKSGTTYIPLNGTYSTINTSWTDIPSSDVYIKAEDYGKNPYISFEASLKTSHEGGGVSARLFDVTNGIAVDGSEISTTLTNYSSQGTVNLPFWSGNNLYRVQIRSLDNQEVFFASGRVKISSR